MNALKWINCQTIFKYQLAHGRAFIKCCLCRDNTYNNIYNHRHIISQNGLIDVNDIKSHNSNVNEFIIIHVLNNNSNNNDKSDANSSSSDNSDTNVDGLNIINNTEYMCMNNNTEDMLINDNTDEPSYMLNENRKK